MHVSWRNFRSGSLSSNTSRGFTLVELMITVAVLAILLGIAAPSLNDAVVGSRLGSHANTLVASVTLARSEAIKRNTTVTLCVSANGTSCATTGDWEQGWIVACKTTDNIVCNGTGTNWIVLHRQQAMPSGFKIIETSGTMVRSAEFAPTGLGATPATFKVCRAIPTVSTQQRQVSLSFTGRPSVSKVTSTTCA